MKHNIALFSIVVLAIFLRFYNLSHVPPSPSLDEVSIGFNAYSILQSGRDEYGEPFPIILRAYDDWRPALYVYLVIPFIKLLGLNVVAVRLPSVILSVLTVVATYFLVREILKISSKESGIRNFELGIATTTAGLLAISPWHIYISRLGHEANVGLAFFVFGLLFLFRWRILSTAPYFSKRSALTIAISAIFFALSFTSYQAEKVFIPVFLLGLLFILRTEIMARKKEVLIAVATTLVILIPFFKATLEPNALTRFKATNIFEASSERFEEQAKRFAKAVEENRLVDQIIYNRRVLATKIVLENYISHFNPHWLFTNPSSDRHKAPNLGLFYLWELPFFILGLLYLIRSRLPKNVKAMLVGWMLIAPLPAAITTDAPHAMRIYNMLPAPQIIESAGFLSILFFIKKFKVLSINYYAKNLIFTTCFLISVLSMVQLCKQYFFVFPKTQSQSFQYALGQAIKFVLENEREYDKVVFSNSNNLYQSYMFFLFYSRYDPEVYQKLGGTISGGFAQTHAFGKFEFRPIDWKNEKSSRRTLYVGNPSDFPNKQKSIFMSRYLNGGIGVKAVDGI